MSACTYDVAVVSPYGTVSRWVAKGLTSMREVDAALRTVGSLVIGYRLITYLRQS